MKITVVGSGTAGLLSALVAKNKLPKAEVLVIADPDTKVIGVGEGTVASFCDMLESNAGININALIANVKPVVKYGLRLNFGKKDFHYAFETVYDFQYDNKELPQGFYFDGGVWGQSNHSMNMLNKTNAYAGRVTGAFHIDNKLFLSYLTKLCNERGINIVTDKIESIQREGNNITSLNEKYVSDYFIDCSGFKPLLSKAKFHSYSKKLLNDKALFFRTKTTDTLKPYTEATTMNCGWLWRIDHSTGFTGNGYVYSSKYITDEEAVKEVEQKLNIKLEDSRIIPFKTGRLEKHWIGNVITIGNSDGFMEPLESTSIMGILKTSKDVFDIIRYGDKKGDFIDRYNKFVNNYYDITSDFVLIHFCFNDRLNTPYWKEYKKLALDIPRDSLAYKFIEYYLINGVQLKYLAQLCSDENAYAIEGYWNILRGLIPTETDRKKWRVLYGIKYESQ